MDKTLPFYATVFRGLEPALAAELTGLGCAELRVEREAVAFRTTMPNAWRLLLLSRLANKIVLVLDERPVSTAEGLYRQAFDIAWSAWFTVDRTFAVESTVVLSSFGHSGFCSLKVKDAVADRFRKDSGRRPDVDREHPDVYVDLRIVKNVSTIGINISGERLFKRGYRTDTGPAPVKETLAAGIMDFVKPEAFGRLIDPMAGSGTLAIEAASRVLGLPAGRFRKRFGFERVKGFDAKSFASVRSGILTSAVEKSGNAFRCQCSDISDKVLPVCRQNIRNAGLSDIIEVRRADFFSTAPTGPAGVAVFNPPYGLRMQEEEDIGEFYKRIGDTLKKDWSGWTIWILTEKGEHMKRIGLRPSRKVELYNGAVECRLLKFEMY